MTHWTRVRILDFVKAPEGEPQRALIPASPGLYCWTHDMEHILGAHQTEIDNKLATILSAVGRERESIVPPYFHVKVKDRRQDISFAKRALLHEVMHENEAFGQWLGGIATSLQRPLYVGMTGRLHRRIREHLAGRTGLRERLESVNIQMLDLTVAWVAMPPISGASPQDPEAEDSLEDGTTQVTAAVPRSTIKPRVRLGLYHGLA